MAIQHVLPFTVPGATPTVLADIAPWQLTRARVEDAGPGTQGGREMSVELQQYLEPEHLALPWWLYPGARSWLALQQGMTPARVEALVALAGRSDEGTVAEVAARFSLHPNRLLRWQALAENAIRRLTTQMIRVSAHFCVCIKSETSSSPKWTLTQNSARLKVCWHTFLRGLQALVRFITASLTSGLLLLIGNLVFSSCSVTDKRPIVVNGLKVCALDEGQRRKSLTMAR